MNRTIATALLAATAALAGNAFADDITVERNAFNGSRTRAEAQAELAQFQKAPNPWSTRYDQLARFKSGKTREQVAAEYVAARNEVAALNGEDSGSAYLAQNGRGFHTGTQLAGQPANAQ